MKILDIIGKNYLSAAHTRIACRGLVLEDEKLLLSHEVNTGWYMIPGGGLEPGESIEEGCIRELREETGCLVEPVEQFLTLREYYGDWEYITHYFLCRPLGQTRQQLTDLEQERGLIPEWVELKEALAIFAEHEHIAHHEEKRGTYQREHRALTIFLEAISPA